MLIRECRVNSVVGSNSVMGDAGGKANHYNPSLKSVLSAYESPLQAGGYPPSLTSAAPCHFLGKAGWDRGLSGWVAYHTITESNNTTPHAHRKKTSRKSEMMHNW